MRFNFPRVSGSCSLFFMLPLKMETYLHRASRFHLPFTVQLPFSPVSLRIQGRWKGKEPGDGEPSPAGRAEERGRNRLTTPESGRVGRSGACSFQCQGGYECSWVGCFCLLCTHQQQSTLKREDD